MSNHSTIKLEEGLVGCILNDSGQYFMVAELLKPDYFSDPLLGEVYGVMAALLEKGKKLDINLICHNVKEKPKQFELSTNLLLLAKNADSASMVEDYAEEIRQGYQKRKLDGAAAKIGSLTGSGDRAEDLAEQAHKEIDAAITGAQVREVETAGQVGRRLLERISESHQEQSPAFTITTGVPFLDELLGPLLPGQLIWIGGRSGSGKSTMAGQITTSVACQGISVSAVLTEMTPEDAEARALQSHTGIGAENIQAMNLNASEEDALGQAIVSREKLPIHYDAGGFDHFDKIKARLKRLVRLQGVKLIILDHFHDMKPIDHRKNDREQKNELAKAFKQLAKELGVPIIMIAQMKRWEPYGGVVKSVKDIQRPNIQSFEGAAGIEQSADKMIFIHRPEWFLNQFKPSSPGEEWENDHFKWKDKVQLIKPKSRNSEGNQTVTCFFNGAWQRFQYNDPKQDALV